MLKTLAQSYVFWGHEGAILSIFEPGRLCVYKLLLCAAFDSPLEIPVNDSTQLSPRPEPWYGSLQCIHES